MLKKIEILILSMTLFACNTSKKIVKESANNYYHWTKKQKSHILSNGHQLHYIDEGTSDKVILLLHGVPTSSWLYRHMIPSLVESGFRVIVPDMLGYGNSSKPKGYDIYDPIHQQAYLKELMDTLSINTWTHVCHDGGGLWTWEFIKNNPGHINKLIILNSVVFAEGFFPPLKMNKNWFTKTYTRLYTTGISRKSTMEGTLKNGLIQHNNICTPVMLDGYISPMKGKANRALYHFFSNANVQKLPNYETVLEKSAILSMVIWGAKDKILRWEPQKEKVQNALNIKNKNIHILPNAKHFIQEEYPNEIVNWIKEF